MTPLERARACGIDVAIVDLGDWGEAELRSEYDPSGPRIAINARIVEGLQPGERGAFVQFCIAHELYHHRERSGETVLLRDRSAREAAADAYARALMQMP